MEKYQTIFLSFYLLLLFIIDVNASTEDNELTKHDHHIKQKLFVFGDSYADTGNSRKHTAVSWKPPYGITFPGKPAGRFSDGRVLTDYIASFLGIKSPVAYREIKWIKKWKVNKYGMNFAFGGTGVFDTMEKEPNMSTQINFFEDILLERNFYSKQDLNSSVALVSLAGNDYGAYLAKGGNNSMEGLANFTTSIIDQLVGNLRRIQSLGVRKIAVTALEPLGCLPPFTASSSFQNCTQIFNSVSDFHNQMLHQKLQALNNQSYSSSSKYLPILVLDLHSTFLSAFKNLQKNITTTAGNLSMESPLKPCCVGISKEYSCGSFDENGAKKYIVCKNPELSFFWDMIHPSQNGWSAVFSGLRSSLHKLI
ncbi:GDSL esterase/lipase At5g03610-like [Humulus lupulus]|uniref:GDSL esterase/lipase At5g03610-like n=1 Tax=Humulus lupulus TaxID=3486 RepID=UPI002B40755C|nr:GDSL esterase/lipase At5g03610-like [Humulus lupulus]